MGIPMCSTSTMTKLATPGISLVLFALLSFSEELEDPFGLDEHDLPWPILLGTVSHCTISSQGREVLDKALAFFNQGCTTSSWNESLAKQLFGSGTKTKMQEPGLNKRTNDTGV